MPPARLATVSPCSKRNRPERASGRAGGSRHRAAWRRRPCGRSAKPKRRRLAVQAADPALSTKQRGRWSGPCRAGAHRPVRATDPPVAGHPGSLDPGVAAGGFDALLRSTRNCDPTTSAAVLEFGATLRTADSSPPAGATVRTSLGATAERGLRRPCRRCLAARRARVVRRARPARTAARPRRPRRARVERPARPTSTAPVGAG